MQMALLSPARGARRQPGRKPWAKTAPTPFDSPSPARLPAAGRAGVGVGEEAGIPNPRLAPWATLYRPSADGLTSSANF
jgi:hypothetical protein